MLKPAKREVRQEGVLLVSIMIFVSFFAVNLLIPFASANKVIFYESFDNLSSINLNNGTVDSGILFVAGVKNNAINFSGSKKVCYPIGKNINLTNGTIEFWVNSPPENARGFFDIGTLSQPNSMGIFRNSNALIMEVKNNVNYYVQSWAPESIANDGRWHYIAAPISKRGNTTYFKVCLDGACTSNYMDIVDSNPDTGGNFCVGWSGWYGYSQSLIDEFKVYDYIKTNEEMLATYSNYSQPYDAKSCVLYKPQSKGVVKLNCSGLTVNDKPFTIKGVGYQALPIGSDANYVSDKQAMFNDQRIYRDRDFPLLRSMNVNTIRTWGPVLNGSFLDAAYNNGDKPIYVAMNYWINCNEDYSNPTIRQQYINDFKSYVAKYKDYPAVLVWTIGNENNLGYCSNPAYVPYFYSLGNDLAKAAYEVEGQNYHPVGIINGDLGGIGSESLNSSDSFLNYTDFWGNNVYPGKSFGDWFKKYSALTGKPLFITEYGIDSLNNTSLDEQEDAQAEWDYNQWIEINKSNLTIGSTLMEYSDEFWKAGSPSTHDYGGYVTSKAPDNYANEEWWGVVRVSPNSSGGVNIVTPRKVYYKLRDAFGSTNQTPRLIAYYNFDNDIGNTIKDNSGNNYTGSFIGNNIVPLIVGEKGSALQFDGIDDYALIRELHANAQDYTISLWLKPKDIGVRQLFVSYGGNNCVQYMTMNGNGAFYYVHGLSPYVQSDFGSARAVNGQWINLVASFNGKEIKTYVNGNLVKNISTNVSYTTTGHTYLGGTCGYPWHGGIDEVKIYDRALSDNDVKIVYNQTKGNLIAYYSFDEQTGNTVNNGMSSLYVGSLIGNVTRTIGIVGNALKFPGNGSSYVLIRGLHSQTQNYSISFWLKPESVGKRQLFLTYGGNTCVQYMTMNGDGRFYYVHGFSPYVQSDFGNYRAKNGTWVNLAATYDGKTIKTYVNGNLTKSLATNVSYTTTGHTYLGGTCGYPWHGGIDEVKIYDRVLNESDIKKVYSGKL